MPSSNMALVREPRKSWVQWRMPMKNRRAWVLVALMVGLFSVQASAAGFVVLVDPGSDEVARIEELGYTPVGSMDELIEMYDPATCSVGIAHSGFALADLAWFDEFLATGATVVGVNWDVEPVFVYGDSDQPEAEPGLFTVVYMFDEIPIAYPLDSEKELADILTFACLYTDSWSDMGSIPFDFSDIDMEAMLEEILAEAGPVLFFLDKFLQPEWEYHVASLSEAEDLGTFLNGVGSEGWELVAVSLDQLIFKRRAMDAERLIELIFSLSEEMIALAEDPSIFF